MHPMESGQSITYKQFPVALDERACSRCRICVSLCECFTYDEADDRIVVNTVSCKGCGICVAACPSSALSHIYDDGMFYESGSVPGEEMSAFDCSNCMYLWKEEPESIVFCQRRFDMGKALSSAGEGKNVVVKSCLFSDEKIEEKSEKVHKTQVMLRMLKLEEKLRVE